MTRLFPAALCVLLAACGKPGAPPVAASDVQNFKTLFAQNCSGCHGENGLNGAAQALNDPLYLNIVPRDALLQTVEQGRPGTSMPAFAQSEGGQLLPKQIAAIVDGIERNWAKTMNLENAPPFSDATQGNVQEGAAVYRAACYSCHGPQGVGGPVVNPSYLTLVSDQGLRTSIIVGRPALGMPDWKHYPGGLSDRDILNLVAWLASQRPSGTQMAGNKQTTP